eukprot:GFYU01022903.1.p1 GENE.GFYU01022903.1~~GFYU01022903.1.p1  ORF type:complete len:525 (+),score=103.74 GFYU01022903.1:173-1747(+)
MGLGKKKTQPVVVDEPEPVVVKDEPPPRVGYTVRDLPVLNNVAVSKGAQYMKDDLRGCKIVKKSLQLDVKVIHPVIAGTPAHTAAFQGDVRFTKLALDANPEDTKAYDARKRTPLHLALQQGHRDVVNLLTPHMNLADHPTLAHTAVRKGLADNLEAVLLLSADPNAVNDFGATPIMVCIEFFNTDCMACLLSFGADTNFVHKQTKMSVLDIGIHVGQDSHDMMEQLVAGYANITVEHYIECIKLDKPASLSGLLVSGVNPNVSGTEKMTPLMVAAQLNRGTCIETLFRSGMMDANVADDNGNTPIMYAVKYGSKDAVSILMKYGAASHLKNNQGKSALHWGAISGQAFILRQLIGNNTDLEVIDQNRNTPLMLAALYGNLSATQLLLQQGAFLKTRNKDGYIALHFAAELGHYRVVAAIADSLKSSDIEDGLHIDYPTRDGQTALHLSCLAGDNLGVEILLQNGANFKAAATLDSGAVGNALDFAVRGGNGATCQYLLDRGAVSLTAKLANPKYKFQGDEWED